jgi:DNA-directed RNA polymerase subunit RPC12/RpoP
MSEELKDMVCPQCKKRFILAWNDWRDKPQTLMIRGCPSGGIYDVAISCPHCNYEEQL